MQDVALKLTCRGKPWGYGGIVTGRGQATPTLLPNLQRNRPPPMSSEQIPVSPAARIGDEQDDGTHQIAADLAFHRLVISNVVFYGAPKSPDRHWVLVDAGVFGSAGAILRAARSRYGKESRPAAIILTHGHFHHAGALEELAQEWDVPVYAHLLELPYLNGTASYPAPDPTVGGGLMLMLSRF